MNVTILKFRDTLIEQLASVDFSKQKPIRIVQQTPTTVEAVEEFHNLENIPSLKENVPRYLRCTVCTKAKRRKETRYRCKDCENTPALCPVPCFGIYHGH